MLTKICFVLVLGVSTAILASTPPVTPDDDHSHSICKRLRSTHHQHMLPRPPTSPNVSKTGKLRVYVVLENNEEKATAFSKQNNTPLSFKEQIEGIYRRVIYKAVFQHQREAPARIEEAKQIALGNFLKGRQIVGNVWGTPIKDQLAKERKAKIKQHELAIFENSHKQTQNSNQLHELPQQTPRPATSSIQDIVKRCTEPFSIEKIVSMTGITNNTPLIRLAEKNINKQDTTIERRVASRVWTTLSLIKEPNFCAEAVMYVLQQESLKHQKIVAHVWLTLLAKIKEPELHGYVVDFIMGQPIEKIQETAELWKNMSTQNMQEYISSIYGLETSTGEVANESPAQE